MAVCMKTTAIIVAAGQGKRMGGNIAKQYMMLCGKPVLYYALAAFEKSRTDDIVIVVRDGEQSYVKNEIVDKYGINKVREIVAGGKERFDSVYRGITAAREADYVLIHDGVRPLVSDVLINQIIDDVKLHKACIPGVAVKDTIKAVDENNEVTVTCERKQLRRIQTPQAFDREILSASYNMFFEKIRADEIKADSITDDAVLVEKMLGVKVYVTQGDYSNIKITTPEDLTVAAALINA